MAPERRVRVAVVGAVTLFDHVLRLPSLTPALNTAFVPPVTDQPGAVLFGGCGLNQAVAMAKLGVASTVLGLVGPDFDSLGYAKYLDELSVAHDRLERVAEQSGHSYLIHADDGATLLIVEEGAATKAQSEPAFAGLPPGVEIVCINMPFDRYAGEVAAAAVEADAAVLIAGQLGTATPERQKLLSQAATWLCCNETEAAHLGLDQEDAFPSPEFPKLRGMWMTKGAQGIYYRGAGGERFHVPNSGGRLVEPTGAGDGVVAGIVAGLSSGLTPLECARVGSVVASFVIEGVGAQTAAPTADQLAQRFEETYGYRPGLTTT